MQIDVNDIQKATELFFEKAKRFFGETVEVDHDFYWQVDLASAFEMQEPPVAGLMGSLWDDVPSVTDIASEKNELFLPEFMHVISLLTYLQYKAESSGKFFG